MRKFDINEDMLSLDGGLLVYFKAPPSFILKVWEIKTIQDKSGSKILWRQLYDAFMVEGSRPPWSKKFFGRQLYDAFMVKRSKPPWSKKFLDENHILDGFYSYDRLFLEDGIILSLPGFSDDYNGYSIDSLKYPHFVSFDDLYIGDEGGLWDLIITNSRFEIKSLRILQRDIERKVLGK